MKEKQMLEISDRDIDRFCKGKCEHVLLKPQRLCLKETGVVNGSRSTVIDADGLHPFGGVEMQNKRGLLRKIILAKYPFNMLCTIRCRHQ